MKASGSGVVITGKKMVTYLMIIAFIAVGILIFFKFGKNIGEWFRTIFG